MIIKHADDKTTDIDILQALLTHPSATPDIRKRIEQEVRNIKAGVRGESEATQEMKVRYGESRNWAIIHDLRVEFGDLEDGRTAVIAISGLTPVTTEPAGYRYWVDRRQE